MNVQSLWVAYTFAVSSSFLFGQHPDYQKNLEQAWSKPVYTSFHEPLVRELRAGTWTISASIEPDYVGEPVYFRLEGSYRNKGGSFIYRECILSLAHQAALLQTAHPEWSETEVSRHLVFAQLQFQDAQTMPPEGLAFMKSLQETRGPVLAMPPGPVYLHPTIYSVRSRSAASNPIEYSMIGWRGTPKELEAELQRGGKEEPLVLLLNRMRASYLSKWKEMLREEDYASLLNQMDQAALGMAFFEWACQEHELPLAEKILARGLSPDQPGIDGSRPLIAACGTGNRALIQRLLDAGASLNAKDAQGRSALTSACGTGDAELVEWLIGRGAHVEFPEPFDQANPILAAVNQSNLRLVQSVFRAAGPIPDRIKTAKDENLFVRVIDPGVASWLLSQGCKPSPFALEVASRRGSTEIMKLYLHAGLDPNAQSAFGNPLISAVEGGSIEAVELLLSLGADPTKVIPQRIPGTALDLAIHLGNKDIVKALAKAKASAAGTHSPDS